MCVAPVLPQPTGILSERLVEMPSTEDREMPEPRRERLAEGSFWGLAPDGHEVEATSKAGAIGA